MLLCGNACNLSKWTRARDVNRMLKKSILCAFVLIIGAPTADAAQYKIHDDCLGDWDYCESLWIGEFERFGKDVFDTLPFDEAAELLRYSRAPAGARRYYCNRGRALLSGRGFDRLRPVDCDGPTFTYLGRRDGVSFRIRLNPRTGRILGLEPI